MATAPQMQDFMSSSIGDDDGFDDVEMAATGINMLLNNGFDESFALFERYKNESPLMHAGYSFVFFMQALMSFEEDKLGEALKVLQETERKCSTNDGFMKSVKRKFSKKKKVSENTLTLEEKLQNQVIVADSVLYQALLTFTNQDIPSYIKGGWFLRKAWKIYEKAHKEITFLMDNISQNKITKMQRSLSSPVDASPTHTADSNGEISAVMDGNDNELTDEVLTRLLGSVNFGYGTFQLCISMVPPRILKLIEFLGFEGDREVGLSSLVFTSHTSDMKAPLATLALLWYHTVLRPFFAIDGANHYDQGTKEAEAIMQEKEKVFPNSSLFLFFKGRIHRLEEYRHVFLDLTVTNLAIGPAQYEMVYRNQFQPITPDELKDRKENSLALTLYQRALAEAKGQREIELMCLHEITWCHMLKLNWPDAQDGFARLQKESKWSQAYYTYLVAVCMGSLGELEGAHDMFRKVPGLIKKKNNQIEAFVGKRADKFKKHKPTQEHCRLLTLEMIFLWHALPTCKEEELRPLLEVCDYQKDNSLLPLKCLLEGAIYKQLGEEEMATTCLKEALARHQGRKDDMYIPAFTLFELASVYMSHPESVPEAKANLQLVKDSYKDYDFENRLSVRVNNALKQLKSGSGISSST